jgi:hypothetical protein
MTREVSVFVDDASWRELLDYEPPSPEAELDTDLRTRLAAAPVIPQAGTVVRQIRVLTLNGDQARTLESWLVAVTTRAHPPRGARVALTAVREGLRLAR